MPNPIEGTWQLIRAELNGERAPELIIRKTELELQSGSYVVRFDGQAADRGTYQLGARNEFQTLTLIGLVGPNARRTIPCIFQLVGDRIRICYGLNGVLPENFTTSEQNQRYLAFYRRAPKAA